jgi:hypothetical protein
MYETNIFAKFKFYFGKETNLYLSIEMTLTSTYTIHVCQNINWLDYLYPLRQI